VTLDGRNPFQLSATELAAFRNKQIGFVFQDHCLLPQCTVLENVLIPTLVAPAGNGDIGRARQLIEQVGLADRIDHRPAELSGGERQRVAIARALVNRPSIILADEPTGNLDSETSVEVMAIFQELRETGITIVLVTHEPDIALYAARVVMMKDGKLLSDRRQDPLQPASPAGVAAGGVR
jgi:putative ABC transport system ATP-binding protein